MNKASEQTRTAEPPEPAGLPRSRVLFDPGNVWKVGLVVLAVFALGTFLSFLIDDGGSVFFTVLMSWFAAMAMAPLVNRMAKRMKRGLATIIVMVAFLIFVVLFFAAFGRLFIEQLVEFITELPDLLSSVIDWVNKTFDQDLQVQDVWDTLGLTPENAANIAAEVGGQALGILGSFVGSVFSLFTVALFTFYLSADGHRFRRWLASLFPAKGQSVFINVWDLTVEKTGGYVGARVVLATINASTTAVVFFIIDMPSWLALSLWTGIVAQFVPTIGTYIAIILPVIVGLLSDNPTVGIIALVWALLYQQVENLTIEPRISAKAVDVHPAVAFGSVLLGAALFGVAGAFLAVPVAAMLLALLNIYSKRYELMPELTSEDSDATTEDEPEDPVAASARPSSG